MTLYRDTAVVLRTQKLGEADRIVTMLTRRHGKVRAVAKGIRRTKSRFGARLEPLTHVDLQCFRGRELDIVTQAEILDPFSMAMGDYARYTAGSAMLETTDRLTQEHEPSPRMYALVVAALRALDDGEHDPELVLDAYVLRALAASGYEPALRSCASCGAPGPHGAFHAPSGGVVCGDCRPAGAARPSPAALGLLASLAEGDWTGPDASDRGVRREAAGLTAVYLEYHLDRRLRALALVER